MSQIRTDDSLKLNNIATKQVGINKRVAIKKEFRLKTICMSRVLIVGALLLALVASCAYAASIQYNNNKIINNIAELQKDIDYNQIQLTMKNNIVDIEKRATDIGMVYADSSCVVHIN